MVFILFIDWEIVFDEIFKMYVKKMMCFKYRFFFLKVYFMYSLFNFYELKDFNVDFLRKSENFNELYIVEYWGLESNFLKNGLGVCFIYKEKIIVECVFIFYSGIIVEIDIVINFIYRG